MIGKLLKSAFAATVNSVGWFAGATIGAASSGFRTGSGFGSAFRWGRIDDATVDNQPPGRTGDTEIGESSDLMNRRGREGYLNSQYLKRSVHLLRDLVVGRGLNAFADPIDSSFGWDLAARSESDLYASFDYALESDEAFEEWANEPSLCDASGSKSWSQMCAMLITENCLVGEVLMVRSERGPGRVPLQYQLIEKEQIDCTRVKPQHGERIVEGFELDANGREVGVWLYDVHPHDYLNYSVGPSWKSQFIPARRYSHIFKPYRPSQHIGAPWTHAQAQPSIDLESYTESELATAIKNSLMAFALYMNDPDPAALGMEVDPVTGKKTRRRVKMGRNPVGAMLGKDDKLELLSSDRPNANATPFLKLLQNQLANSIDVSPYSLTGDFSETNYGGFRGAMNLEQHQMVPIQDWLGRAIVLPVRREFNEMAVSRGLLKSMSAQQFARERRRLQRFDLIGPGRFFLDPDKEIEASISTMRAGIGTLKIWCAMQGLHWIRVLRQIALENKIASTLGVVLDHSKGQGGQRDSSSRESSSETSGVEE